MPDDHVKVDKASLLKVIWALITVLISGTGACISFFWSWEKNQITETEFQQKLAMYDHGTMLSVTESTQPPREGMAKAIQMCQSTTILTQGDVSKLLRDSAVQRELIVKQYEWLVRITAASSEPNPNKRASTGRTAVLKFRAGMKEGQDPDDAAAGALEVNPYQLR